MGRSATPCPLAGTLCDDNNPAIKPGVGEICRDGFDNNCDGQVDEVCSSPPECEIYLDDIDGDGFSSITCGGTDCNDEDIAVNPGVPENAFTYCSDGIDHDCDGVDPICIQL